jgi:hypothetical protein
MKGSRIGIADVVSEYYRMGLPQAHHSIKHEKVSSLSIQLTASVNYSLKRGKECLSQNSSFAAWRQQ